MPLNVPVTITLPPIDCSYTVHTDRQRWSADQLAAEPDGRGALEAAVREGVRKAAPACAYAGLTEADVTVTEHPDDSVAMVGRVLCSEAECHVAARRRHLDAAEAIEAKTAADWAAEKHLGLAPGDIQAGKPRSRGMSFRERALLARMLMGVVLGVVGGLMGQFDYERPASASSASLTVLMGEKADKFCDVMAFPTVVAGVIVFVFALVRHQLNRES
ncbi:hypothetical protein ACFYY1_37065 [Streptomyces sp. NPDC001890]|uniref:hypothetical protein n=1 Tax=Streptomyces sp. NPDC001890 TaxID=3364620 RepID=UPI00367E813E